MTKADEARNWALSRVGCPYIYGGTGAICTPSYREARAEQYPQYREKIYKNCPILFGKTSSCTDCKWCDVDTNVGKRAYDCAQLVRWCMNHIGVSMPSGANSQWTKTNWERFGDIGSIPRDKVCLVYRYDDDKGHMGHTGIYLGDGYIVHAKGHDYGVVKELLGNPRFTHWGIPYGLYTEVTLSMQTLRKGDTGASVKELQRRLNENGFSLAVDGVFGTKTYNAVRMFQSKHDLTVDGVVGQKTWQALGGTDESKSDQNVDEMPNDEAQNEPSLGDNFFVLSMSDALRLRDAVNTISDILSKANWGDES